MSQLALLFGRVVHLPADHDGSFDDEVIEFTPVTITLSARQSEWMTGGVPRVPDCPGCVLFGCCALHDEEPGDEELGDA